MNHSIWAMGLSENWIPAMPQEILVRPHEEAYIKAHKDELKRFHGMDLVFEARMRFLEMPPDEREKLAPNWINEDQPLWHQGGVPLTALIDEQPDVPVLLPITDYSLPRRPETAPVGADEPAPEPVSGRGEAELQTVLQEVAQQVTRTPEQEEPEFALTVLADTPERQERQERPRLENQQTDVRNILERQLLE